MRRASTAILLTCAAIGVAGGALLIPANWLSLFLTPILPPLAAALAGLWIIPPIIALRLLERPGVGILVGLISGLVIVPFSGSGFASVGTNLWWAFFAELPFLLVLYRFWKTWMFYAGVGAHAILWTALAWAYYDLGSFTLIGQVGFFAAVLAGQLLGAWLGILIADRLRAAGVARVARRRPRTAASAPPAAV